MQLWWKEVQNIYLVEGDPSSGPLYVAWAVIRLNADLWVRMSRLRFYVVFFTEAAGGQRACQRVCAIVDSVVKYRQGFPALPVADLLATLDIHADRVAEVQLGTRKEVDVLGPSVHEEAAWKARSAEVRAKHHLPSRNLPFRQRLGGVPDSARMRDSLAVGWHVAGRALVQQGKPCFNNLSQCVAREPWGQEIGALTTRSLVYCYTLQRLLLAEELWCLQGHPMETFKHASATGAVGQLVGEGMFLPCLGTVLAALWLNPQGGWWEKRLDDSSLSCVRRGRTNALSGHCRTMI